MSARDRLVEALEAAALPGVTVHRYKPPTPQPGDAWPQWVRTTTLTYCSVERTFWLLVGLPSGTPGVTEDRAETLSPPLVDVASDVGDFDVLEPVDLVLQAGTGSTLPALRVTLRLSE